MLLATIPQWKSLSDRNMVLLTYVGTVRVQESLSLFGIEVNQIKPELPPAKHTISCTNGFFFTRNC